MAGPYYVDSAAAGTNAGSSWTNAWTSFWSVPTLAAGEIAYVASRHVEADVAANKTLTGPASGAAAFIYSVTTGTTTYEAGAQIKSTGGAHDITFDGSFNIQGVTFELGDDLFLSSDTNEGIVLKNCTIKLSNAGVIQILASSACQLLNCTVDLTADSSGADAAVFSTSTVGMHTRTSFQMLGGAVTNGGDRSGSTSCLSYNVGGWFIGVDLSSLSSSCEMTIYAATTKFIGCKMPSTFTLSNIPGSQDLAAYNCAASGTYSDHLVYQYENYNGKISIDQGVTLNSGATADDGLGSTQQFSIKLVSDADCAENIPLVTDWFYVWNATTGLRNLDIYVGAASAMTDADIWAEYFYLGTDDSEHLAFATTQRANGSAAATYTTTGGTWSGTVTEEYYLRSAVTIQEKGLVMGRVCVGKASLTAYVDPRIVLS